MRIGRNYAAKKEWFCCIDFVTWTLLLENIIDIIRNIFEYDESLVNDLKQNAVPSELFNQVSLLVI